MWNTNAHHRHYAHQRHIDVASGRLVCHTRCIPQKTALHSANASRTPAALNAQLRPPADSYWCEAPRTGFLAYVLSLRGTDFRLCKFAQLSMSGPSDLSLPRSKPRSAWREEAA